MRRSVPQLVLLLAIPLAACGSTPAAGGAQSAPAGDRATNVPTIGAGASAAPTSGPPASVAPSETTATVLPAACAEGLGAYLVAIEPLVASFDPDTDTLGDLYSAQDAAQEKSIELLMANDARAPYSCSEVGLEWAYFDARTPWDAVLAVAGDAAPGTVGYLSALRAHAGLDEAKLADYGIAGCDAAVAEIKAGVKQASKDVSRVDELAFTDGLELLGRYNAYMHDVQDEVCPRDQLGNDEFGFMSAGR